MKSDSIRHFKEFKNLAIFRILSQWNDIWDPIQHQLYYVDVDTKDAAFCIETRLLYTKV